MLCPLLKILLLQVPASWQQPYSPWTSCPKTLASCSGDGASSPQVAHGLKGTGSLTLLGPRERDSARRRPSRASRLLLCCAGLSTNISLGQSECASRRARIGISWTWSATCFGGRIAQALCSSMNLPYRGKKKSKDAAASLRCDQCLEIVLGSLATAAIFHRELLVPSANRRRTYLPMKRQE